MKKKRKKKKRKNRNQARVTSQHTQHRPENGSRYDRMLHQGHEQLQEYYEQAESLELDRLAAEYDKLVETEPYVSLNEIAEKYGVTLQDLYYGISTSKDTTIVSYYSRSDVQNAIFSFAKDRKIAVVRNFHPLFQELRKPEDILPLMLSISQSYTQGRQWPSMHGTISRYSSGGQMWGCDLVAEIDFKRSWSRSFDIARPLVKFFRELGIYFLIKFTGKKVAFQHHLLAKNLSVALRKIIKIPKGVYSWAVVPYGHTCIPYPVNEHTGLVCVPVDVEHLESFSPEMAQAPLTEVSQISPAPDDAPQMTEAFLRKMLY